MIFSKRPLHVVGILHRLEDQICRSFWVSSGCVLVFMGINLSSAIFAVSVACCVFLFSFWPYCFNTCIVIISTSMFCTWAVLTLTSCLFCLRVLLPKSIFFSQLTALIFVVSRPATVVALCFLRGCHRRQIWVLPEVECAVRLFNEIVGLSGAFSTLSSSWRSKCCGIFSLDSSSKLCCLFSLRGAVRLGVNEHFDGSLKILAKSFFG